MALAEFDLILQHQAFLGVQRLIQQCGQTIVLVSFWDLGVVTKVPGVNVDMCSVHTHVVEVRLMR